jgi:diaminopimelate dehydrogenase
VKGLHVAIAGFGKLGYACAEAVRADEHVKLTGVVRRDPDAPLPLPFEDVAAATDVSGLGRVDGVLVCVPTKHSAGVALELLQRGVPIVECASLHGEAFERHFAEIDRAAVRHRVPAVVGAGWDPGVLSLFRSLFALSTPKGHTEVTHRPGVNLHHTTAAEATPGVRKALSTELRTSAGTSQRYVYVELEQGADLGSVEKSIRGDPHYLGEETFVVPVDSIAALEEEGHGIVMERRGATGRTEHQLLLLEARYSEAALAGAIMVAAARALPDCTKGAYTVFDLPLGALWGELRGQAREEWI